MSDVRLRQLERQYHQNPSEETQGQWHALLKRSGLCLADQPQTLTTVTENLESVVQGTRISFRVYGTNLQSEQPENHPCPICKDKPDFGVQLYYFAGMIPPAPATLASVQGGSAVVVDNTIRDLDPDGQTQYSVVWDSASDGVALGEQVNLMFLNIG
jgi:hypothetical protein